MSASTVILHGHVYQPPRADPRTGEVPVEPSAAPFHDWNERITAECYRPNAFARIVDDDGRIVRIVNNFERMSFNVGPTLARWLDRKAPDVMARMVEGDQVGHTAVAQPFHHAILPLAAPDDVRTELAWGIADFRARFGREPEGVWLPETAVSSSVLQQVAAAGLQFTILAPHQVVRHPGAGRFGVDTASRVRLAVYDGPASHDMAFGAALRDSRALVERLMSVGGDGGVGLAATDAETFGHHHRFTERAIAHALFEVAPSLGVSTGALNSAICGADPQALIDVGGVVTSAWSCAHGVERWQSDCGCSSDGAPGWHQRWRAPLREALRFLRDESVGAFQRLGAEVFVDPMAARDAYGVVIAEPDRWDEFVERYVQPLASETRARVLLQTQVSTLASMTSCAWFFADVARREITLVMQEAQRAAELFAELGVELPVAHAIELLANAPGNIGLTAADVWRRAAEREPLPNEIAAQPWAPAAAAPLDALLTELVDQACAGDDAKALQAAALMALRPPADIDSLQNRIWASFAGLSMSGRRMAEAFGFQLR